MLLERIRAERRRRWEEAELEKMRAKAKEPKDSRWKERYSEPAPVDTGELPELPEGWGWATLEEISSPLDTICYGVVQPGEDPEGGIPLLRVCDVENGRIRATELRSISPEIDEQYSRSRLRGGEVVVTVVGTIGRVAVVSDELSGANIARAVARVVPSELIDSKWIAGALQSPRLQEWLTREAREVARKTLNVGTLAQTAIPIAPAAEMRLITRLLPSLLDQGFATAEHVAAASARLAQQDASILAKAFRGELVPQDRNDEPASVLLERIRAERQRGVQHRNSRKKVAP